MVHTTACKPFFSLGCVPHTDGAVLQHFFAYSLENCFTYGDNCRLNFNAVASQQDIEDTYLPAFQSAVQRGDVSGLMCSCELPKAIARPRALE